ncbi:MAG: cytochrome c3 family protein [Dissulfurispiraceae bacterium]
MKIMLLIVLIIMLALPLTIYAKGKEHIEITMEQTCSECHAGENDVWENSKHGLMGVKCVVCHGDPNINFVARPTSERCVGCHSELVAGRAEGHKMKQKSCWTCHDGHSLKTKSGK